MQIVLIKSYTDKPWRSPDAYRLIEESLSEKWPVKSINTKNPKILHSFLSGLKRGGGDRIFVFNIAEYLDEKNKAGFLPALLEEWNIPHLGSSAEAITIGLDKARTKELLRENQVPTPRYFVAKREDTELKNLAERIGYPLIIKPIMEGGHIGIREDSIVYNHANLEKVVNRIFDNHNQPALVEEFLTGPGMREFSVGIIEGDPMLFTPIEIDYDAMDVKEQILSFEAAQNDQERTKPVHDQKILAEIIDLSKRTFAAVGARGYSRVDLRMNETGCYVLEINIMPGLGLHSFLPEAAKDIYALEYNQLIQKLTTGSIHKQKNGNRGSYAL